MAALIESRRDTLALRRRIGGGGAGWVADVAAMAADAGGLGGGGNRRAQGGSGGCGGDDDGGGGKLVVALPSSVGPAAGRMEEMEFSGAVAVGGGRYASSDGEGGSELFGSIDSDGLPFLLRPAAGEAEGPAGWEEGPGRDDGGERARLHMESVRQVRPRSTHLLLC